MHCGGGEEAAGRTGVADGAYSHVRTLPLHEQHALHSPEMRILISRMRDQRQLTSWCLMVMR
jgi:hypothetical protein